jgi:hypothetical protein
MLDAGLEIHRWLWGSVLALPILLVAVFRLIERHWRLGKQGVPAYAGGLVYVVLIAFAVPFLSALLESTPLARRVPLGPLPYNPRALAALLVFAVLWVEPEIAQFKMLKGAAKLIALMLALEVLAPNMSLPASEGLGPNTIALRSVVLLLTVWSLFTIAMYVGYCASMKPRQSLGFNFAAIGMIGLIAASTLPPRLSVAIIGLLVACYPLLVAVGEHAPPALAEQTPLQLYQAGVARLTEAWRSWTS